ncbi:hypothetical protein PBPRA2747 [Photobacterium profundum SS9]|uniref:Uncharacterized protein n=1 Tax=Photobacterium profundum (strain SS9) TaxID=298386 RepID=Q6LNK7_PHOPR|nr:hypothetical protein PBPRA2747 [Photobacterium profundum SS9]
MIVLVSVAIVFDQWRAVYMQMAARCSFQREFLTPRQDDNLPFEVFYIKMSSTGLSLIKRELSSGSALALLCHMHLKANAIPARKIPDIKECSLYDRYPI